MSYKRRFSILSRAGQPDGAEVNGRQAKSASDAPCGLLDFRAEQVDFYVLVSIKTKAHSVA